MLLRCANCDRPLKECCDIFEEAWDDKGNDVVLCGICVAELDAKGELGYMERKGE